MLCLPKSQSNKLKEALKKGDFTIGNLYNMTSEERATLLSNYIGNEMAHMVNAEFEKAMISNQKKALAKWAEKTFNPKEKIVKDRVLERIKKIEKVLDPKENEDFLKDLAASKLKMTLTPEEAKGIVTRANKLQELAPKTDENGNVTNVDKFGLPTKEYFIARNEMENYVTGLNPASSVKVFTQMIGRNMMLFSLHTPLFTLETNVVNTLLEGLNRRFSSGKAMGLNGDFAKEYVKNAITIYNNSHFNVSDMVTLDDNRMFGERAIHAEGKGAINKIGRVVDDIVIKKMHGLPYVASSALNFADSANLLSSTIARQEGLSGEEAKARALELFKDATSLSPKTESGASIRTQAQADAKRATFTNDNWGAQTSLAIRSLFNKFSGDLRLGDLAIPFAKIPATAISQGIDTAGVGIFKAAFDFKSAWQDYKENGGDKSSFKIPIRNLIRVGLGMAAAYIIASNVDKDNFIGAYPTNPGEADLLKLKGGIENSIKIGDHWVSLEYFGPLAPVLAGFLYSKKYGTGGFSNLEQYGKGVAEGLLKLPGVSEIGTVYNDIANSGQQPSASQSANATSPVDALQKTLLDFIKSRTIPAFITDALKVKADPVNNNIFGAVHNAPSALQQFLFGSRISQSYQGPILSELNRLDDAGVLPSLTDIEKSPQAGIMKAGLEPAKYTQAINDFKTEFRANVQKLMSNEATNPKNNKAIDYMSATDSEKAAMINTQKTATLSAIMKDYGVDSSSIANLKASAFEGHSSNYGNPNVENLMQSHSDDGTVKGTNPKGEPQYERFSLTQSEKIKKDLYNNDSYWKENGYSISDTQLDHIVPIEAGGTMTKDNLMLISQASDQANQRFEDYLGQKYRAGTISRSDAITASIDYKINKTITLKDVENGVY